ncbi:MAG: radical SAM protein [Deltaproteobacteria bacterium]|nr:radical SAM protein [Deltaproteobacteria bacterium]
MDCDILRILYLKANGEVLCNCDVGERVSLGWVETADPDWTIGTVFSNDDYAHMRTSLAAGRVPWDGICQRCAFLRPGIPLRDELARRVVTKLHVEPSLACHLDCRCCTSRDQRRTRPKPHVMALETYERVLGSLRDEGFALESVEYCGQGEPLTHPRFHEFIRLGRQYFPQARQRLTTNGNLDYRAAMRGQALDEVVVSCDGVRQESYEQYRRRGKVDQALQFMSDAAAAGVDLGRPTVVWKYILFEFNDSDAELREAQRKAERLGVDTLLFTVTSSAHRSQRYDHDTLDRLLVVGANVHVDQCATFHEGAAYGRGRDTRWATEGLWGWLGGQGRRARCKAHLDEVVCLPGAVLALRGWAAATTPLTHVEIYCDGELVGQAKLTLHRDDVFEAHPYLLRQRAGFYLSVPLTRPLKSCAEIGVALRCGRRRRGRLVASYTFAATGGCD